MLIGSFFNQVQTNKILIAIHNVCVILNWIYGKIIDVSFLLIPSIWPFWGLVVKNKLMSVYCRITSLILRRSRSFAAFGKGVSAWQKPRTTWTVWESGYRITCLRLMVPLLWHNLSSLRGHTHKKLTSVC